MVARISQGKHIRDSFYYNENKVKERVAKCLLAENYPRELADLSELMRLEMLEKMAALRPRTEVNSLHISLNFDPSEQISEDKYREIAKTYMERIGFGNQPYLVYQHFDAGHPHLHLLTTNIEMDGSRIDLHTLGVRKSEPARKEIEELFGLVKAEGQKNTHYKLGSAYAEKVVYGRKESKKSIGLVLNAVLDSYKYTSLQELNAVLGLYNVKADRGSGQSRTYLNGGLVYRILDNKGQPVGVPVKASAFYNKPGLKFLEARFKAGETARQTLGKRIRNAVDMYFIRTQNPTLPSLIDTLKKGGVDIVLRKSDQGRTYGITYVDHQSKVVFNGSDLDKSRRYSAKAIIDRLHTPPEYQNQESKLVTGPLGNPTQNDPPPIDISTGDVPAETLLELLLQAEEVSGYVPYELSGKKKRKKKRKGNTNI